MDLMVDDVCTHAGSTCKVTSHGPCMGPAKFLIIIFVLVKERKYCSLVSCVDRSSFYLIKSIIQEVSWWSGVPSKLFPRFVRSETLKQDRYKLKIESVLLVTGYLGLLLLLLV